MTTASKKNVVDLSDDFGVDDDVEVAGTLKIGEQEFRVVNSVNAYLMTGIEAGDAADFREQIAAMIHDDDRVAFDTFLSSRKHLDPDKMITLFRKIYELAADRPTK